jgi:glycosyltransferase involved in cell wall biosynthesis
LVRELKLLNIDSVISAPSHKTECYQINGIKVSRFSVSSRVSDIAEMYGEGDDLAATEFDKILIEEKPDIVHLHAYTRAISLKLVKKVKLKNIPVVLTYHSPTVTCQRGTLLRWGASQCDGLLNDLKCTECTLHGLGLNKTISQVLARLPKGFGAVVSKLGGKGGIWTAIRSRDLVTLRLQTIKSFLEKMDHVVAVCQWVEDLLVRNGIPTNKISLCRQELTQELGTTLRTADNNQEFQGISKVDQLRIIFLGRLDPSKGVDVVIKALALIKKCKIVFDIYGVSQGVLGDKYEAKLRLLAKNDSRIQFQKSVNSSEVVKILKNYDALVVPSRWMETGPLVVLEAFAAGIPVIGSNIGGIRELVTDGLNGLLVDSGSPSAWSESILKFNDIKNKQVPFQVKYIKNRLSVAEKMRCIYQKILVEKNE